MEEFREGEENGLGVRLAKESTSDRSHRKGKGGGNHRFVRAGTQVKKPKQKDGEKSGKEEEVQFSIVDMPGKGDKKRMFSKKEGREATLTSLLEGGEKSPAEIVGGREA